MPDDLSLTVEDVEALATKLDGMSGLDDVDKSTLAAVFALAGQAVAAPDDEVSGFAVDSFRPGGDNSIIIVNSFGNPNLELTGAFRMGLSNGGFGQPGGAQMGGQPHM